MLAARKRAPIFLLAASVTAALARVAAAAVPVAAGSLIVRVEAGPHVAVAFDAAWHVTSRRTISTTSPANMTATDRVAVPGDGTWLRIVSGPLAGRWVHESVLAYVPGL